MGSGPFFWIPLSFLFSRASRALADVDGAYRLSLLYPLLLFSLILASFGLFSFQTYFPLQKRGGALGKWSWKMQMECLLKASPLLLPTIPGISLGPLPSHRFFFEGQVFWKSLLAGPRCFIFFDCRCFLTYFLSNPWLYSDGSLGARQSSCLTAFFFLLAQLRLLPFTMSNAQNVLFFGLLESGFPARSRESK